ncbi:hypothetical protein VTJ83DRAFT_5187 [Remersonia thermophila]|uniref:Cation/H+ exchanger transmembrane domain-containing protein n=1 Tax=Remersonia thermophila TaxID=72144 RepID=A0ABR4DC39_9PEZI
MAAHENSTFLEYREPNVIRILTLISFFLFLALAEWLADRFLRAPLVGQIIVGLLYGLPLANILVLDWQETFLALGYLGLILIIFEGGLTIRLDLLRRNLVLSVAAALIGVLAPIALSFALLYAGFGSAPLEAFIVGTALCSTSLGTTFAILSSASKAKTHPSETQADSDQTLCAGPSRTGVDYSQTRVGTVLVSAALIDDVCGLVLISVIHNLRDVAGLEAAGTSSGHEASSSPSLGWIIGRPVLASALLALLTPAVAMFAAGPAYRRFFEPRIRAARRWARLANVLLMAVVLSAFLAIAAYAGASMLLGAFLAGAFLSSLPPQAPAEPQPSGTDGDGAPGFADTFDHYLGAPQRFVFQPLFFASIGFAIPFGELWAGEVIWKGIVYTVLMALGKLMVGVVVPAWDLLAHRLLKHQQPHALGWRPAALLGAAMVARGEIGLLVIQVGLNETPFLSQKAFAIGVWAIVLNTILGPVMVGALLTRAGTDIAADVRWGVQAKTG